MEPNKIVELIKACKEGDTIVWDEPNGEVYKIKVEKKYPKGCQPTKESLDIPYPAGHNWEGLTPRQVSEAYKK